MKIVRLEKIDSTNMEAFRLLENESHVIVLADEQSMGYGRNGAKWYSLKGNIHLSIGKVTKPDLINDISARVVCKLIDILERYISGELEIKWPNDILLNGKKVVGTLVESKIKGNIAKVVIGIGVNYSHVPIEQSGCLKGKISIDREMLENFLVEGLKDIVESQVDRKELLTLFYRYSYFKDGDLITLNSGGIPIKGIFRGYTDDFAILIETEKGKSFFYSGEVKKVRKN